MAAVTVHRRLRSDSRHRLLSAGHVQELAAALELLAGRGSSAELVDGVLHQAFAVATTPGGLRISTGRVPLTADAVRHYTVSVEGHPLGEADARELAELIVLLRHDGSRAEVVAGREGVCHLLILQPAGADRGGVAVPAPAAAEPEPALSR